MDIINQEKIERLGSEIGPENVPVLLEIFLGELTMYIDSLNGEALEDKERYLKEISHALKSSAASFGAEALCALAIEIDAAAKSGEAFVQSDYHEQMLDTLSKTHETYSSLSL